jgi:transcriptional regulator with XRE-family HTH domain
VNEFLGRELKRWREKIGWKQKDLAGAAGMAASTVSAMETEGRGLTYAMFLRLSGIMGADPVELADRAYFYWRNDLSEEADRLKAGQPQGTGDGRKATPSIEEILTLFDKAVAAIRSLFQAVLRRLDRNSAESVYLQEIFQRLDLKPDPPGPGKKKRRKTYRRSKETS